MWARLQFDIEDAPTGQQLREKLEPALPRIRFPLMCDHQILGTVYDAPVLLEEEIIQILRYKNIRV